LHDPLNDVSNLREAAEAIVAAERDFEAGLVYSPGPTGEIDMLIERAKALPELGAVRVLLHDPTGSLQPYKAQELVGALAEASGLPVGIYVQGAGGSAARGDALGSSGRSAADRVCDLSARVDPASRLR